MISSFHIRTHRDQESLEPIEKNHHAAKELGKEAVGEETAIAVGEVISEAVAEESSVADSPLQDSHLRGGETQVYKRFTFGKHYIPVQKQRSVSPWLHARHAARHAEGRGYSREDRDGGLNDEAPYLSFLFIHDCSCWCKGLIMSTFLSSAGGKGEGEVARGRSLRVANFL